MKKKLLHISNSWFIWSLLTVLVFSCKEPAENPVPKGDDGQVFAIDTQASEIPYLVIDTRTQEIPYNPGVSASMKIYQEKKLIQEQAIEIEYRGKTSFRLSDKKAFNIETVDAAGEGLNVSFFGLPEEEDWRLIGHVVNEEYKYIWDRSMIYNHLGYEMSRSIGRYASRGKFVEIEVNGEYMGVYYFCEKLKRSSERIDIKSLNSNSTNSTGGYILKIDKSDAGPEHDGKPISYFLNNWSDDGLYNAQNSFRSKFDINGKPLSFPAYGAPFHPQQYLETYFNYEYPKAENITPVQKDYIAAYVESFETALLNDDFTKSERSYTNFIDLGSFVDFMLLSELCRNVDAYRISTYLEKDRDSKLKMGPIWDLNIGFDEGGRVPNNDWVFNYNRYAADDIWQVPFWWIRLMEDPQFKAAVKQRWTSLRGGALANAQLQSLVDDAVGYLQKNGAVTRNYAKWDKGIGVNYDQTITDLKKFLSERASWMDQEIGKF